MQEGTGAGGQGQRRGEGLTPGRVALNTIAVLAILGTAAVLVQVKQILILFLIGILFASAVEPVAGRFQARGLGRGQSILAVYLLLAVVLGTLLALLVPTVAREVARFVAVAPNLIGDLREAARTSQSPFLRANGPSLLDEIERRIRRADIPTEQALSLASYLPTVLGYLLQGIIAMVTTLMIAFYWITEKPIIKRVFLSFFTADERRNRAHGIWNDIETKLGGWIRGQLILMAIVGLAASLAYSLMGLRFAVLLGLLAGLCEIIPLFGPWISGTPAVLIALTQDWRLALGVVAFMVTMQMIEGNVLIPRVMKGSVGLSPLLVVLAVLVGVTMLGPVGGIIAIPVAATIQVLIGEVVRSHQEAPAADEPRAGGRVFHWRPAGLPRRLRGVQPGPAVVSPVVGLPPSPADPAVGTAAPAATAGAAEELPGGLRIDGAGLKIED
jgi:predicted PurR-regulated permease PerM